MKFGGVGQATLRGELNDAMNLIFGEIFAFGGAGLRVYGYASHQGD